MQAKTSLYQKVIASILTGSILFAPVAVLASHMSDSDIAAQEGGIITKDSPGLGNGTRGYWWHWNPQDYLDWPSVWTDCPEGQVLIEAYVHAYATKNKNIANIKCTPVSGLTGPVIVQELAHFTPTPRMI